MKLSENYNSQDRNSIIQYAEKLRNKTFEIVLKDSLAYEDGIKNQDEIESFKNMKRRGGLPNLIEKYYFGYKLNSDSGADFSEVGLELKVTPYEIKKKYTPNKDNTIPIDAYKAGERLVLTTINFNIPIRQYFADGKISRALMGSHVWLKCKNMLLIYYFRDAELKKEKRNLEYPIHFIFFFDLTDASFKEDLEVMCDDYDYIISKIKAGRAQDLSEGDTMYLSTCTKGKDSSDQQIQFYEDLSDVIPHHWPVKKRAFCLKQPYMTALLKNRIIPYNREKEKLESIHLPEDGQHKTFAQRIQDMIAPYIGMTDTALASHFGLEYTGNKAQWTTLAYRMLGIKNNKAEQFEKANIKVKTLSLEPNNRLKENISFKPFKFNEVIRETWEYSWLNQYFSGQKFFFVIFQKQKDSKERKLLGTFFWNMPRSDIEGPLKDGWNNLRQTINDGVQLVWKSGRMENNLPKSKDNPIMHVRPHTQNTKYIMLDGTSYGKGKFSDTDALPDGRRMTIQSYWLNNSYIEKVIVDKLHLTPPPHKK